MLTELREKSQSFIIYILFGILIFVFVFFFGPQSQGCAGGGSTARYRVGWAAEVHGEEIDQREVEAVVRRYASDVDSEAELARMRRQALLQLIDQEVLAQRARALGLAVSEADVTAFIADPDRNPEFPLFADRDGKFDYDQFVNVVRQRFGTAIPTYRKLKARELLVRNYLSFLESQVKVSEPEIRQAFERAERKWNLEYVEIPIDADAAAVPEPTAAEGEAYAKAHPDEVKAYYEAHKRDYVRGKEIRVRRVLVKVADPNDEKAKAEARKKAEELLAEARKPDTDFAELARKSSEGYYRTQGGDMGWQSQENTAEPDYAVYAKLEEGQISDVVESPIGFWFVKAEEVRPAIDKSLDEVQGEIGRILARKEAAKKAAREKAEALLAAARETETLAAAVEAIGGAAGEPAAEQGEPAADAPPKPAYEVKKTGLFSADRPAWDRIPGIGPSEALARRLDDLTAEKPLLDEVLELEDRFVIVRLGERVEPDDAAYAEKKDEVATHLRRVRQAQLFGNWEILLFGPAAQRDLFLKFSRPALFATLPGAGTDPEIVINEEAFPPPAAEKTAQAANP